MVICYDIAQDPELSVTWRVLNRIHAWFTQTEPILPHTSVVIHGYEHEFNKEGTSRIAYDPTRPGRVRKWIMGTVSLTRGQVLAEIDSIREELQFIGPLYHPLTKNCLNYSAAIVSRLLGQSLPTQNWTWFSRFSGSAMIGPLYHLVPGSFAPYSAPSLPASGSFPLVESTSLPPAVAFESTSSGTSIVFIATRSGELITQMRSPSLGHRELSLPVIDIVSTLIEICRLKPLLSLGISEFTRYLTRITSTEPVYFTNTDTGNRLSIHRGTITLDYQGQKYSILIKYILRICTLCQERVLRPIIRNSSGSNAMSVFSQVGEIFGVPSTAFATR